MTPFTLFALSWVLAFTFPLSARAQGTSAEQHALDYLSREVPAWSVKNKCFSCHNNGDGARALYTAVRLGHSIPKKSLADTSDWLTRPEQWDKIGDAAGSSDKNLARIQFAAALVDGLEAGVIKNREVLAKAATLVAENQKPDGSWQVDAPGNVGSPATYGPCLATCLARRTLQKADPKRFKTAIGKADRWFERAPINSPRRVQRRRLGALCKFASGTVRHGGGDPGPFSQFRKTRRKGYDQARPSVSD